jgi:hypothetical protein
MMIVAQVSSVYLIAVHTDSRDGRDVWIVEPGWGRSWYGVDVCVVMALRWGTKGKMKWAVMHIDF